MLTARFIEKHCGCREDTREIKAKAMLLGVVPETVVAVLDILFGISIGLEEGASLMGIGIVSLILQTGITISESIFTSLSAKKLMEKPNFLKLINELENKMIINNALNDEIIKKEIVPLIIEVIINAHILGVPGSTDLNGSINELQDYVKREPFKMVNAESHVEEKLRDIGKIANGKEKINELVILLKLALKLNLQNQHLEMLIKEQLKEAINQSNALTPPPEIQHLFQQGLQAPGSNSLFSKACGPQREGTFDTLGATPSKTN